MVEFIADVGTDAAAAAKEAAANSGKFAPLPKGKYQATIVPLKDGGDLFEVVPFSTGKPEYAGKNAVRVRVRIVDESPTGAKRTFFERIPLFSRYAPSQKNPQGAPVRTYFDFFAAVGYTEEQILSGKLANVESILGKRVTITLSDPIMPDEHNELGSNEVAFWGPAGDVNQTPRRIDGVPVANWLDAHDNLLPGTVANQVAAAGAAVNAATAPAAPPQWGAAPAAAPAAAPQWGAAPAAAPAAAPQPAGPEAWNPGAAAADAVLQQAASSSTGF
jgi:hypothetical protein